ncbi:MAG: hypothetical protein HRT80_05505 [Henriciella sp.]|nr:hypothetical protein [Henriciella sp.]
MSDRALMPFYAAALGMALSGCSTAADVSENAIRLASFNRIQATPFTDRIDAKDCQASLDEVFGFPRTSLDVKRGVRVSQAYSCDGRNVVSKVRLRNLNNHPMYCGALTESSEAGTWVGPQGVAFFEYAFAESRTYDCFEDR